MRRILLTAVLSVAMLGFASAAQATTNFNNAPNGAHYANGASEPLCTVSGTTVSCTGTAIQGVGNTNATLDLAVTSTVSGVCHNPGTNSKVVEPFSKSVTNTTSATLTPSKNGRLVVPAQSATGASSGEFTCPNPNWNLEITSNVLSFQYTLTFAGFTEPAISISG